MSDVNTLLMENKLLRKLGTRQGFFQYYFERLPKHRTQAECFHEVNGLYFDLFGEERYTDFDSFRKMRNQYLKR